jgi:hypothetical protein
MLFDLRGRGRRRTVQVVYIGLAVLFGAGLVLFGVGGGFGGTGILNAVNSNEGSNAASFSSQIKKYEKLVHNNPSSVGAWEQLTTAQLHEAGGEAFVSNGQLTGKGHELFAATARSWEQYLALNPPKPSLALAKEMLRIYGEEGLNQPSGAVQALQIIVAAEPSSAHWNAFLALYAYKAKNTRVGDLASTRALALIPAGTERTRVKKELEAAKKNPGGGETFTGHTNGKAFTVKKAPNGSYTGAVPSTTPAPVTGSTTKK